MSMRGIGSSSNASPLPLHTGGKSKQHAPSDQFANAMSKGLSLVGMSKTKSGSDDKEVAYVLRQNSLLRLFACIVIFAMVSSVIIFSTYYELSIVKRGLIHSEMKHHKIEKADHEEFVRASLMLQQALQLEIHELKDMEEFRAHFQKAFGTYANDLVDVLKKNSVPVPVVNQIVSSNQRLTQDVQDALGRIIHKFVAQSKAAKEKLHQVSEDIVRNVEEEAKLDERFRHKMEDLGEDPYAEDNGGKNNYGGDDEDKDDYAEDNNDENNDDKSHPDGHDKAGDKDGKEKHHSLTRRERIIRDEEELGKEIDLYFKHLESLRFPDVSLEMIAAWSEQLKKLEEILEDETREADVDIMLNRFQKTLIPGVPEFNPDEHESVIEYMTSIIEEAKLMRHKQELVDLYKGWKENAQHNEHGRKISAYTVIASMERLAEENDLYLLFEWLEDMNLNKPKDPNAADAASTRRVLSSEENKPIDPQQPQATQPKIDATNNNPPPVETKQDAAQTTTESATTTTATTAPPQQTNTAAANGGVPQQ